MKKLVSALLAVLLVLSAACAFAEVALGAGSNQVRQVICSAFGHRFNVIHVQQNLRRTPAAVLATETVAFENLEAKFFAYLLSVIFHYDSSC